MPSDRIFSLTYSAIGSALMEPSEFISRRLAIIAGSASTPPSGGNRVSRDVGDTKENVDRGDGTSGESIGESGEIKDEGDVLS